MSKEWVGEYEALRPKYERFTGRLYVLLQGLLKDIPHILLERTKDVESFARKISRPEKSYERFEQVTDLSGLRILTYYLGGIERVRNVIEREFQVDWESTIDKSKELKPNQLGYRSINYIVCIPYTRAEKTDWREFANLKAEIQVDTLTSHVWYETEHPLYKQEATVPLELRRRLYLVKALLEVADLELQEFKDKEVEVSSAMSTQVEEKAPVSISPAALVQYVEHSDQVQELVTLASEAGFDIMSSLEEQLNIVSDLADACLAVGIRTTYELEKFLIKHHSRTERFLRTLNDQLEKKGRGPWSVGGAYLVLFLIISAFRDRLDENFFTKRGWSKVTVNLVREIPLT